MREKPRPFIGEVGEQKLESNGKKKFTVASFLSLSNHLSSKSPYYSPLYFCFV